MSFNNAFAGKKAPAGTKRVFFRILLVCIIAIMMFALSACSVEIISAYDIAVQNGFVGTETEWLESLKGADALSAYDIAVKNGFIGTETEWLESLKVVGETLSAYDIAVKNGFIGTETEWLESLKGTDALSAYDIAVQNGFVGTEIEWIESLKGADNGSVDIDALYAKYLEENSGKTYNDFLQTFAAAYSPAYIAINKALCSTVSIRSVFQKRQGTTTVDYAAAGSGVIFQINDERTEAYIITNYHVIYDLPSTTTGHFAKSITVCNYARQNSADFVTATLVGGSIYNDIAILKITGAAFFADSSIREVEIADSNPITVGETAYVVGDPAALGISATAGIISVDSEIITMKALNSNTETNDIRVIRVDAAINGGNSGGGLYDDQGRLIGIVNAKIIDAEDFIENIGYAIPSNTASAIADSFINGDGKKIVIGITTMPESSKAVYADSKITIVETIKVQNVTAGSLADGAGIKVGDIITKATLGDGANIRLSLDIQRYFYLSDFILKAKPDETLTINALRNGEPIEFKIVLSSSKRINFD